MNSAAIASLRGRRLATVLTNGSQLGLDYLFTCCFTNLDDALVVLFSRFRNPQDVLSGRNISQHDTARASDTAFPFVVDIHLGPDWSHYHETRRSRTLALLDIFRRRFQLIDPVGNRRRPCARIYLERLHDRPFDIRRNIRA